jgi:ATP-binding cassette, subfamily B, bacterial
MTSAKSHARVTATLVNLVRAVRDATAQERVRLFFFLLFFVLANVAELACPWAIGYALDPFVKEGFTDSAYNRAIRWVLILIGLRLAYALLHHSARYLQNTVAYRSKMYTLNKIFGTLLRFPLTWHVRNHSGENLSKLNRSTGAVEQTVATYLWQIIEGLVKVLFAGVAIIALDGTVALTVLGVSFITIFSMVYFNQHLSSAFRQNNRFLNRINRICIDYLYHMVTVKTLRLEHAAKKYLSVQEPEGLRYSKKISFFSELKWGSTTVGYALVIGLSLFVYFHNQKSLSRAFEVAEVYVLLSYLDRIFQAIGSFTAYYSGIIEASIAYEDGQHIVEQADILTPLVVPEPIIERSWRALELSKVTFSYNIGERPGLKDVDFTIKRGDKVALVGPSGHGKSTLLKVLAGLLVPETYALESNLGTQLPLSDVASISLLIPQEPEIFSESLLYNLTMGQNFRGEEIDEITNLCRLEHVIKKLPFGLNTDLAEKGLNLSVGEKQRVAMARGLLRVEDRDILLLDEPTSSLDPFTEKEIFINLLDHYKQLTIITACHRLNLVPLFDKVVYVLNGRIEEIGTFQELIDSRGFFSKAWEEYQEHIQKE